MSRGKAEAERGDERSALSVLPGYWRRHADNGDQTQHGKPQR
jgi:hypothetical protein